MTESLIKELVLALEPFAEVANEIDHRGGADDGTCPNDIPVEDATDIAIMVGQLRRAASALSAYRAWEESGGATAEPDQGVRGRLQAPPSETSAEVRARSRLHALQQILKFATRRQEVSEAERDRYRIEKPDDPYWANSEQCAAHEARHIKEYIAEQMKQTEASLRRFHRGSAPPNAAGVDGAASLSGSTKSEGEASTHDLKTWPEPFAAIRAGLKPWELRKDDREYQTGDVLRLREWSPTDDAYTGEVEERRVGWLLHGGNFGLPSGYVIMTILPTPSTTAELRERIELAIFKCVFHAADTATEELIAARKAEFLPAWEHAQECAGAVLLALQAKRAG